MSKRLNEAPLNEPDQKKSKNLEIDTNIDDGGGYSTPTDHPYLELAVRGANNIIRKSLQDPESVDAFYMLMRAGNIKNLNDVWSNMPNIVTHQEKGSDTDKQAFTVKTRKPKEVSIREDYIERLGILKKDSDEFIRLSAFISVLLVHEFR
jgi:hypothetical protein